MWLTLKLIKFKNYQIAELRSSLFLLVIWKKNFSVKSTKFYSNKDKFSSSNIFLLTVNNNKSQFEFMACSTLIIMNGTVPRWTKDLFLNLKKKNHLLQVEHVKIKNKAETFNFASCPHST